MSDNNDTMPKDGATMPADGGEMKDGEKSEGMETETESKE